MALLSENTEESTGEICSHLTAILNAVVVGGGGNNNVSCLTITSWACPLVADTLCISVQEWE